MSELYLTDLIAQQAIKENPNFPKRTINDITPILKSLKPTDIQAYHTFQTKVGFILKFPKDRDVNIFFHPDAQKKLLENNLHPDLTKKCQKDRVLYISDICAENFDLDTDDIKQSIMTQNHINIMRIDKFTPKENPTKRYLRIYLDSKPACSYAANKEEIKVINEILPIAKMRDNTYVPETTITSNRNPRNSDYPPAHLASSALTSSYYPPAHPASSALPPSANWGGTRVSAPNSDTQRDNHFMNQAPIHSAYQNITLGETHIKYCIHICEILSKGIEDPLSFVNMCQITLKSQGIENISIPHEVIQMSFEKFISNNTQNNYTPPPSEIPTSSSQSNIQNLILLQTPPPPKPQQYKNILSPINLTLPPSPQTTSTNLSLHTPSVSTLTASSNITRSTLATPKSSQPPLTQSGPSLTTTPPSSSLPGYLISSSQSNNKSPSSITPTPSAPTQPFLSTTPKTSLTTTNCDPTLDLTSDSIIDSSSSNHIRLVPKNSKKPIFSTENRFTLLSSPIS